jgi:two-component system, NtrC family, response regulator GlrR
MPTPTDSPLHILIVDDDPSMVKALSRLLRSAGHTVETAASGSEALSHLEKEKFDLVITDYQMPGMRGDALAAAIKALVPLQPVLMLTAHVKRLRCSSGSLSAVDMVIAKPFEAEELFEAVAKLSGAP